MNKINIYSSLNNNKLNYVLDFIFGDILDLEHTFNPSNTTCDYNLIYGERTNIEGLRILDSGYLNDDLIFDYNEKLVYKLDSEGNQIPFDIFSGIFFLLSRAEEYDKSDLDQHNRFKASKSLLFKQNLLETAIIDSWIASLKSKLEKLYGVQINYRRQYEFQSTIDVDQFFAFKNKPIHIQIGACVRDALLFRFERLKARFAKHDPYDTFDDIHQVHKELMIDPLYFVLCSRRATFDKNISPYGTLFKDCLSRLHPYEIGIHPSYQTNQLAEKFKKEKELLELISGLNISKSRQHFIRLNFPETYQNLIKIGINEDFSMGYPEECGFRAGTSYPFKWYDLTNDCVTDLRIYPFQLLDVTMKKYLNLGTEAALLKAKIIIDKIKINKGYCSIIWHNSSFFELESWSGWKEVYIEILKYAKA